MDFIKKIYKLDLKLINWGGYLRTIQYFLFDHYKFVLVKKNKELMEKKKSDTCYICALGPSLKEVNFNKLNGDTVVVNHFYKMNEIIPNFVPTYYLMYDPAFGASHKFALDSAVDIYSKRGTVFLLNSRFAKIHCKADFVYYISAFKGLFSGQKYRIDRVMPSFPNVVGVAIGVAMGLGYKKIILLGCDFNSFASPVSNHCYSEKDNQRRIELWYELYRYSLVAHGHKMINAYANREGIEVINSTKGSLIDAYPFQIDESLYLDGHDKESM